MTVLQTVPLDHLGTPPMRPRRRNRPSRANEESYRRHSRVSNPAPARAMRHAAMRHASTNQGPQNRGTAAHRPITPFGGRIAPARSNGDHRPAATPTARITPNPPPRPPGGSTLWRPSGFATRRLGEPATRLSGRPAASRLACPAACLSVSTDEDRRRRHPADGKRTPARRVPLRFDGVRRSAPGRVSRSNRTRRAEPRDR